jgi:hypothetical protein
MPVCTQCGHSFAVGRFCTNCGHPVDEAGAARADEPQEATLVADDWRTGTAERPAVARDEPPPPAPGPVLPPPVMTPNEPARYPLYADEAAPATATGSHRHVGERPPRTLAAWLPWVAGGVVLVLIASIGFWLLLGGDDDPGSSTAADPATSSDAPPSSPKDSDTEPSPSDEGEGKPGKPADVSRSATAVVPETAPPNEDVDGNLVRYEARNMLDGVPGTCWRMTGDGTGETIVLELADPTTITEVGMVNGYAKTATDGGRNLDWYLGNRRVLSVEWVFDDGTSVSQDLESTRNLQTMEVDEVTTESVEVRLVSVSPPGTGPSRRDYTAISELSVVGAPA